jgi:Na+-translocating ferredoxin:NAD+ oxidoreductase RnfC subunit
VARLLARLSLTGFAPAQDASALRVTEVRVPLDDHAGPPAQALVVPGQEVYRGQVIGRATGRDGQLWSHVHASLGGVVAAVSATEVVIRSECHG